MNKKIKEGVSVQELENFGKKYHFEIFFIIYFLLAVLLSSFFFGAVWSIFLGAIGGIVGILLPQKVQKASTLGFQFIFKQEKVTKLILASVGIIVAFFLPPIIFFILGMMGGAGIHQSASKVTQLESSKGEESE